MSREGELGYGKEGGEPGGESRKVRGSRWREERGSTEVRSKGSEWK